MKGYKDYQRFRAGEPLSRKQAILAQCYICNGASEGGEDCRGRSCPLYQFMPHRANRLKRQITETERQKIVERFKKGREALKLPV
ncbi:MAG: hypothetical protein HZB80_03280 [Deltaproteobacteria bacterium]|nr:hypothetical protein [Deltaproteobacteria bacterium]